ncbi:MAG: hypothetical protein H6819_12120 [Phycisphaerales bacterium]|nr:hypothetical protein [Phycisphaerales bacterium]MCB9858694.1 hypothetical protein [Phycisphaerales bacterium]MCB9864450.1 hypothetical protein [Phycisphaerales bacterium]
MTARVKRDRASRPSEPENSETQFPRDSDSGGKPVHASDAVASFVAPASAKPADMHGGTPTFATHLPCWKEAPAADRSIVVGARPVVAKRQFERSPLQPNAPPMD